MPGAVDVALIGLMFFSVIGPLPVWVDVVFVVALGGVALLYLLQSKSLDLRAAAIAVLSVIALVVIVYTNYVYVPNGDGANIGAGIATGISLILACLVAVSYFITDRRA